MEAIISRPKTDAKQSPARKQANKSAQPAITEGDRLTLEAAKVLQSMCVLGMLSGSTSTFRTRHNAHFPEVVHLFGRLFDPASHERDDIDPPEGDICAHLAEIQEQLAFALDVLQVREMEDMEVGLQLAAAAAIDQANEFAKKLSAAHGGLPGTIEDLRALTTFAGIRTFRDRPTPPIRRAEPTHDDLKNTAAHEAGEVGKQLALRCTWDIDAVACEIARLAGRVTEYDTAHLESLLLCYGLRIQALNGQVIAFFDQDGTTAGEMHRHIFMRSRPFPGDEQ